MALTKKILSVRGESSWFQNQGDLTKLGGEEYAKNAYAKAKRAGIITTGKIYNPSIAGELGASDPDAWISMAEGGERTLSESAKSVVLDVLT